MPLKVIVVIFHTFLGFDLEPLHVDFEDMCYCWWDEMDFELSWNWYSEYLPLFKEKGSGTYIPGEVRNLYHQRSKLPQLRWVLLLGQKLPQCIGRSSAGMGQGPPCWAWQQSNWSMAAVESWFQSFHPTVLYSHPALPQPAFISRLCFLFPSQIRSSSGDASHVLNETCRPNLPWERCWRKAVFKSHTRIVQHTVFH